MSLVLNEPVKKKIKFRRNISLYNGKPPLPLVIGTDSDQLISDDVWIVSTGRFNGLSVVVDDPEEMKNLHCMGFFGKGCLSKRVPILENSDKSATILRERQWKRRKEWSKLAENLIEDSKDSNQEASEPDVKKSKTSEDNNESGVVSIGRKNVSLSNEVIVIADSDTEDNFMSRLNPKIENESEQTVFESLHLSLEEAFFLSYGLGCLQVIDLHGNLLSISTLWNFFCQSDSNFVENYVAYHYFRAKGWVVKPGMQFGGQFILYKKGPVFYHSSYIVIVETYNSDGKRIKNDLTLFKLANLNRLAETSFKEVLICEVHRPEVPKDDLKHPSVLSQYTVRENLIRRWVPNQEREVSSDLS